MSFIGVGGEDWVELDMDLFDRQRLSRLRTTLTDPDERRAIGAAIGADYDVEFDELGTAFLLVDGVQRFQAEITNSDRLMLTGILDPDGPL
ncbi:MAG: hypothetical protein O3C27_04845 [Actinomycetota bacterium]|nr:hypothetical protein [Actinomycetota bacterium]